MKTLKVLSIALLVSLFSFVSAFASETDGRAKKNEETVNHFRTEIAKASSRDWKLYTKAAQVCINRRMNNTEALEWIEHAIAVNRNTYNVMVLGDYHYQRGDVLKAYKLYHEALELVMFTSDKNQKNLLQRKIKKAAEIHKSDN